MSVGAEHGARGPKERFRIASVIRRPEKEEERFQLESCRRRRCGLYRVRAVAGHTSCKAQHKRIDDTLAEQEFDIRGVPGGDIHLDGAPAREYGVDGGGEEPRNTHNTRSGFDGTPSSSTSFGNRRWGAAQEEGAAQRA